MAAIRAALDDALSTPDPADRARLLTEMAGLIHDAQGEIRAARQSALAQLREAGMTLAEIGAIIGQREARVSDLLRGRSAGGSGKTRPAEDRA